jgi:predicted peptidase
MLAASMIASLFQFYLFYNLIITREISAAYVIATFLFLATTILYALSLALSSASKRPWLKRAGILQLLLCGAMVLSFTWAMISVSARVNGIIEELEQWISLISSLIPALFILNFYSERMTGENVTTSNVRGLDEVLGSAVVVVLVSALIFIPKFAVEGLRPADHPDNVNEYLKGIAQPFEARTFISSEGDSLPYRLMKPLDYDSTKQYPLVVCLHGSSAVGRDNVKQVAATLPAQMLSTGENRTKYPAFLFVPQCPRGFGWGGMPEHRSVDALVFETIAALEREFPIDATRRYVSGYSMGGYGAWHFIFTRPEMFAAAVPICGGGDPELAKNVVDIPIWAFHGAKDMNVPVSNTRDIINAIKQAGGNPRYSEFPHAAHDIWAEVNQTTELPEWLFAQKRN